MRTDDLRDDKATRPGGGGWPRLLRLSLVAAAVPLTLAALRVGVPWIIVLTPRWLVRRAAIATLWGLLVGLVAAVPAAVIVGPWSALAAGRAGRRGDRAAFERGLRGAVLAASVLVGLVAFEAASGFVVRQGYRIPDLPTRFADDGRRSPGPAAGEPIDLVVVGESSARGEPYHPWVSVGQVVGWQLERVFPGRAVRVDIRADGGLCLEQAVLLLGELERRPEAVIVFSGHNEFQTRFGWSRNVRHYVDEGPESPLALLEWGRSASSAIATILAALDRYHGEAPPPPRTTRELVDHPICTPAEYDFLREDYHRRLGALAGYCHRIGALPILIVPASNDAGYEPSRSVLSRGTTPALREAFARAFGAARAIEAADPAAALATYRRLAGEHPEFAEVHYRLARLLLDAGSADEARGHFIRARDLDALPLRCPSDFREAARAVADRCGALLIDAPERLARISPGGVVGDRLFHDGQHMNLAGTVEVAREVLEQLRRRRAFGWPESTPVPNIDIEEAARHFGLDAARWSTVCDRSAAFYLRTAYVRHDPAERLWTAHRYAQAARDLADGRPPRRPLPPSLDLPVPALRPVGGEPGLARIPALPPKSAQ